MTKTWPNLMLPVLRSSTAEGGQRTRGGVAVAIVASRAPHRTRLHDLKEFFLIPVEFFQHATKLTYASLGIAAIIGILYFGIMFRKRDGFDQHPTIDLTQATEYQWTKWKLIALVMLCVLSYLAAYHRLPTWFPSTFPKR